jgi:peroxiredoxin-like protein
MTRHVFEYKGDWNGGRNGHGEMTSGNLASTISVPASMGGSGMGTNPDEMLVGAAASCYLMTLAIAVERAGVRVESLSVSSTGTASEEGGLHFEEIVHRPHVILPAHSEDKDKQVVRDLIKRAEKRCMVSNALKGNVKIEIKPKIEVR